MSRRGDQTYALAQHLLQALICHRNRVLRLRLLHCTWFYIYILSLCTCTGSTLLWLKLTFLLFLSSGWTIDKVIFQPRNVDVQCICMLLFFNQSASTKKSRDVSEASEAIKTTHHSGLMYQVLSDYYLYCSISNDFDIDQNLKISDFFFPSRLLHVYYRSLPFYPSIFMTHLFT